MENKRKHLEMIQGTINRMAGYLFVVKGWAVTLVAALFALSAKEANPGYMLIAYLPVLVFWILDGYYLSQERLFRALYDQVRKIDEAEVDFSMNTDEFRGEQRNGWVCSMASPALVWFYVPLLAVMSATVLLVSR